MLRIIVLFCFIIFNYEISCEQQDYYWREYIGLISRDAVVAGKDVYIGQAYLSSKGLIPGQINPGIKEIEVQMDDEVFLVDKNIKILCGPQTNFYWLQTTNTRFNSDVMDKHPVVGGHEDNGNYFIGRIKSNGAIRTGKIFVFNPDHAMFYYVDGHVTKNSTSYEVLLVDYPYSK